jgi:hypothetical protein
MGFQLYREVKDHAPADLDAGELALLLILADDADEETRECFPGMDELCSWMRMTADGVGRVLQRLAKRGLEVRVPVGKDKTGRTIYAMKGVQTTYRLPRFAESVPGPQSGHSANARTTVRPKTSPRPDDSPGISDLWPDASPPLAGPRSGPSPQFPHEEDPHLLPPQRILRTAGIDLGEEDEKRFIDWIKITRKPRSSAWWRKVAAEGDLPGHVADWRAESATPAGTSTQPKRPPHCGACNERTRMVEDNGPPYRCPACHPLAA